RLVGAGPNGTDVSFTLPAQNWTYIGPVGSNQGYRYRDHLRVAGPVKNVVVRTHATNGLSAAIPADVFPLSDDPEPVTVVLTLGGTRYCMSFGGVAVFVPNVRFTATAADAPPSCPP